MLKQKQKVVKCSNKSQLLKIFVFIIFFLSFSFVTIVNVSYFQEVKFNTDNFLTLLPINLILLSITLKIVVFFIYNLGKFFV